MFLNISSVLVVVKLSEPIPVEVDKHKLIVEAVGVISEVISNIDDDRDVLRELLSNAAAREVKAQVINIRVYESEKGLSFTVEDDGVGMNYTKDGAPGRLNKFLNVAQGKQAGYESDEFGAKGFGTKLLYNSREVTIETWDGGPFAYAAILNDPRRTVLEDKKLVDPIVKVSPQYPGLKRGTKITVKGWNDRDTVSKEWKLDELRDYFTYYTVAGYTRSRETPLPRIILGVGGSKAEIKTGFPYLTRSEKADDIRTLIFGPLEKVKKTESGKTVKVILKGGVTVDTGKFGLTDWNGGVFISVNGIPYFQWGNTNKYARRLGLTDDFVRFVAECDQLRLDLSRSSISEDETLDAFEAALDEFFEDIRGNKGFEAFYSNKRKEFKVKLQQFMTEKKDEFLSGKKHFVWWNGRKLIAEPENEYDTAALLWMLEGAGGLPFAHFQTLQYAGSPKGIDLLIDLQEDKESQKQVFAYAEIERRFSNLIRHGHDLSQMSYVFCWEIDKSHVQFGKITPTKKSYKYSYTLSDDHVMVFELKSFPGITVGASPSSDPEE